MTSDSPEKPRFLLGIDLGSASLGWAAIRLDSAGAPAGVLRAGVRIFDPAVTGDIDKGRDESNAVTRRSARLARRQLRRRAARQKELFTLLQDRRLLPAYSGPLPHASEQRHAVLNQLDKNFAAKWKSASRFDDLPLYLLRKAALSERLEPFELGRILYHLSQRRGFKSNRRAAAKPNEKEKPGEVEQSMSDLEAEMRAANANTLGEFYAGLNPHERRIRGRWKARRALYEDEFAQIWDKQVLFHPDVLTPDLRRDVKRLLFFQRPIRTQANLIGQCELELHERRASWSTVEAQRFRLIQRLNDLEIFRQGDVRGRPLTAEERDLTPRIRPDRNTIWTKERGRTDESEQAHGGADHRCAEAG